MFRSFIFAVFLGWLSFPAKADDCKTNGIFKTCIGTTRNVTSKTTSLPNGAIQEIEFVSLNRSEDPSTFVALVGATMMIVSPKSTADERSIVFSKIIKAAYAGKPEMQKLKGFAWIAVSDSGNGITVKGTKLPKGKK